MPTFPRGSLSAGVHRANKRRLEKLDGQARTVDGKITWIVEPADDRLLRGLPCVGSRMGGAIPGTRPDQAVR